jgi:hypothetical protein
MEAIFSFNLLSFSCFACWAWFERLGRGACFILLIMSQDMFCANEFDTAVKLSSFSEIIIA